MNEELIITSGPLGKAALFAGVSILATIVAYLKMWATDRDDNTSMWEYLTGDHKAVVRAIISMLSLWTGASGFAIITNSSDLEIIIAAIALSFMVPQRADKMMLHQSKMKRDPKPTPPLSDPPYGSNPTNVFPNATLRGSITTEER